MIELVAEVVVILLGVICIALGAMAFEDESDRIAAVMFTLGLVLTAASHLVF